MCFVIKGTERKKTVKGQGKGKGKGKRKEEEEEEEEDKEKKINEKAEVEHWF